MRITGSAVCVLLFLIFGGETAHAQTIQLRAREISLRNGESTELADVYLIGTGCHSVLKGTPEVEIMEGPPGVTAVINPAKVVPYAHSCANPVAGGKLVLTAKDVQDYSYTRMILRVNYKTAEGIRQYSEHINIAVFPSN